MKYLNYQLFIAILLVCFFYGCGGVGPSKPTKIQSSPTSMMFINAKVIQSSDNQMVVEALPVDIRTEEDIELEIASKVLNITYLTEGTDTKINNKNYRVKDRRGNTLILDGEEKLALGKNVKLYIPKKTMVISDLVVMDKSKKLVGQIAFDNLKTTLTNSGRFAIVEREKLSSILQEHQLELSGLTDSNQASSVGRLLKAELLLSGKMTKIGFNCRFNIKVIDIATSKIIGVISETYNCSKVTKNITIRSVQKNLGSFENGNEKGWILGEPVGFGKVDGFSEIDNTAGANGTNSSLKMAFEHPKKPSLIVNPIKRDISSFEGITFYAKSNQKMIFSFVVEDSNADGSEGSDRWIKANLATPKWKKYNVKFDELTFSQYYKNIKKSGGDEILTPELIDKLLFIVLKNKNKFPAKSGTLWIDEIKLY